MTLIQKFGHAVFGWDYIYYDGQIFAGPLKVRWLPNGEAYVMLDKMIRIPSKLPPEGAVLGDGKVKAKITPLTPHITWLESKS